MATVKKIWIDADNPPQAQYLAPMAKALRKAGCEVIVTAREHRATLAILEQRGETPIVLGTMLGASRREKIVGNLRRVEYLSRAVLRAFGGRPDALLVGGARGAILTAGILRIPTFVILDYEGVELSSMKWTGASVIHPEVVPAEKFTSRGFPARRLIAIPGIKEDVTFSDIDISAMEPAVLPAPHDPQVLSALVRAPSQTSHYAKARTLTLLQALLDGLASRNDVQVVFSPRESEQVSLLKGREWAIPPVILTETIPLVPLMKTVDWVVTGGGTMIREAAWLGVPGVSVFGGDPPSADEWLEECGALIRVLRPEDAGSIDWANPGGMRQIEHHPEAVEEIARIVLGNRGRNNSSQ